MGVSFGKPSEFGGLQTGIHASQNGEFPARWQGQIGFIAEVFGIAGIGSQDLFKDVAHFDTS
jgi:hypothetical protein